MSLMTAKDVTVDLGDYDIKGHDLRTYYAGFCRRALPEGALWRLALASSCLPDEHVGYKAWLTMVSGTDRFCPELQEWAVGLGETIARMRPKLRFRSREYVPSYSAEWGRQASLDGLCAALWGEKAVPAAWVRASEFGCHRDAYARIRAFVTGSILMAASQYEDALKWAHRAARDA